MASHSQEEATSARRSRVTKKMHPPQRGTQRWERRFGNALVCVRYRDDARAGIRYTTVELIMEVRRVDRAPRTLVLVPIGAFSESKRQRAMALGAKWKRRDKAWLMTLDTAQRLDLAYQVAED
jgi:hypothetical protein